jgi:hypothetical protein
MLSGTDPTVLRNSKVHTSLSNMYLTFPIPSHEFPLQEFGIITGQSNPGIHAVSVVVVLGVIE